MGPKSLLLSFFTAASILLSFVAAASALMHYQKLREQQTWTYNDILRAREDPTWRLHKPVAIVGWLAAIVLSIASAVLFFVGPGKCNWIFPATAIFFVSASGVLLLFVFLQ
jgi:hypothetical protein